MPPTPAELARSSAARGSTPRPCATGAGNATRFTEVARAHWGIENGLHWVLNVTINEDRKRNWKDHGPENISLLRRLALNLAKLEGSKGSIKGKLKQAGWNDDFLTRLLR